MKVLITGGLGFMGKAVTARFVQAGWEVTVLSRGLPSRLGDDVHPVKVEVADILDRDTVLEVFSATRFDLVVHMAALHHHPICDANPSLAIRMNVEGTQNLADAAAAGGCNALVFVSTSAVYAPSDQPHSETSPVAPIDIYGWTKLWAEQALQFASRRHGMSVGIARVFNAYGPGETHPHLIPEIVRQLSEGPALAVGDLSTVRDYVHIRDIAEVLYLLGDAARAGRSVTCNVGAGVGRTVGEVVDVLAGLLDVHPDIQQGTSGRPSHRPILSADISHAERTLGWIPQVPFEAGMREVVAEPYAAG
jgi:UDP-glucose 4-epimerase